MVTLDKMCRTANGWDANWEESWKNAVKTVIETGKLNTNVLESARAKDGRGNICPVTIIMPTLAMEADRDVEKFMKLLDKKIGEAKDMLLERFEWICSQSPKSADFMYNNHTMAGYVPEEGSTTGNKTGQSLI